MIHYTSQCILTDFRLLLKVVFVSLMVFVRSVNWHVHVKMVVYYCDIIRPRRSL